MASGRSRLDRCNLLLCNRVRMGTDCIGVLCPVIKAAPISLPSLSSILWELQRAEDLESLIRRLVEPVRETSTEWIRLTHYRRQPSPCSTLISKMSNFESRKPENENIPNPPKSGLKGIYNQLPSITQQRNIQVRTWANHN